MLNLSDVGIIEPSEVEACYLFQQESLQNTLFKQKEFAKIK